MVVAITAQEQDVYPPRVLVSITGLTIGDTVQLYRQVVGERTYVRGADFVTAVDTSVLAIDAELPFGIPVSYVAVVNTSTEYATSSTTYNLADGATASKPVFTDAVTGLAAEGVIVAWPERGYERDASVFRLASGKTVTVSGPMGQFSSTIELYLASTAEVQNFTALLAGATANTIQIRQGGGYERVDSYISVTAHSERRFSQDGSDPRRLLTLEVEEVDPWAASLEARGYTLQDLADVYTGLTMSDAADDYATMLALAQADLG